MSANEMCTSEPGTQPGPEVTVTSVPTGPDVGLRVRVGATTAQVSASALESSHTPENSMKALFDPSHTIWGSRRPPGRGVAAMATSFQAPSFSRKAFASLPATVSPPNRTSPPNWGS